MNTYNFKREGNKCRTEKLSASTWPHSGWVSCIPLRSSCVYQQAETGFFSYLRAPAGADAIQMTDWLISFHKKKRKASVFFQFRQEISILKGKNPLPFITGIFGLKWLDWPFSPILLCILCGAQHFANHISYGFLAATQISNVVEWLTNICPVLLMVFPTWAMDLCNLMFLNKRLRPLLNSWTFADIKLNTEVLTIYFWGQLVNSDFYYFQNH